MMVPTDNSPLGWLSQSVAAPYATHIGLRAERVQPRYEFDPLQQAQAPTNADPLVAASRLSNTNNNIDKINYSNNNINNNNNNNNSNSTSNRNTTEVLVQTVASKEDSESDDSSEYESDEESSR